MSPNQWRVPLVDIQAQAQALREPSLAALTRVYDSGRFILGAEVEQFEQEISTMLDGAHCVGVSNGTDALVCALLALGIGPGHTVLTTPLTFFATASAILRTGATLQFCDVDEFTGNLSMAASGPTQGQPTPDAIVAVHLFGRPAPLAAIEQRFPGVPIVEDAAQAFGALSARRPIGTLGRLGCFSFFPAKPLGACGDAGMVVTSDAALARRCRALRVHGSSEPGSFALLGGNYRMDPIQAALLRVRLPHVRSWQTLRQGNVQSYRQGLAELDEIVLPPDTLPGDDSAWSVFSIRVTQGRAALREHLTRAGIETAVYYPQAVHLQPPIAPFGGRPGQFPVAERLTQELLALPVGPELRSEQRQHVVDSVREFFGR